MRETDFTRTARLLWEPAAGYQGRRVRPAQPAMPQDETPEIFHHYRILRRDDNSLWELGRGAMGVTYKAEDTNLHKPVALKVINSLFLNNQTARERFIREARAAASLSHRNVATVYHLGHDEQSYFYAMEFIDGATVESVVVRHGPQPWPLALRYMLQVTRALMAAHDKHLVHRDIKPANLMLVTEAGEDELVVKVIDFGLAKSLVELGGSMVNISGSGFVGTPLYASPEQCEEIAPDIRSDIYSLGVVLWYVLTGKPLFGGSMGRVFAQHIHAEPAWDKLPADLPPNVRALLAGMLAKDRADRPQTPAELRREIDLCLRPASEAETAAPPVPKPAEASASTSAVVNEPAADPAATLAEPIEQAPPAAAAVTLATLPGFPTRPPAASAPRPVEAPPVSVPAPAEHRNIVSPASRAGSETLPDINPAAAGSLLPASPLLAIGTGQRRLRKILLGVIGAAAGLGLIVCLGLWFRTGHNEPSAKPQSAAVTLVATTKAAPVQAPAATPDPRPILAERWIEAAQRQLPSVNYVYKANALSDIAATQARAGDVAGSRQSFAAAQQAAQSMTNGSFRANALSAIASAQARAGDVTGSRQSSAAAQQAAQDMTNEPDKAVALRDIATAQARAGDTAAALQTAQDIKVESYKTLALQDIAAAQARAGDVTAALQTAQGIKDDSSKASALSAIAAAQARAGDVTGSRQSFAAALQTAQGIANGYSKADALRDIASAQARAGDAAAALQTAQGIKDDPDKASALSAIAAAQAKAGDAVGSRQSLVAAQQTARDIKDYYSKASAFRDVATAQAKAGDFAAAEQTVDQLAQGQAKCQGYTAITSALFPDPSESDD